LPGRTEGRIPRYPAAGVRYPRGWEGAQEFDRELEVIEATLVELLTLVVEDLGAVHRRAIRETASPRGSPGRTPRRADRRDRHRPDASASSLSLLGGLVAVALGWLWGDPIA
jgi:hypothetical protein